MGKPRMIILVRHAQSEGNKNRDIHQFIPDHRVKLTQHGWTQAEEAGRQLRTLLKSDDTLQFYTSPYRRTRETTEGILRTLTSDDPTPSPFQRSKITVFEEPRLREQDFGNFQPCSAEMERMWQERADYGHFFYRIPDGESAADAYDRVSGFNESLWRSFSDDNFPSVCVLVTHGLMSRVFLMKWYHWSVEYFEDLRNVNHCEFIIMKRHESNGRYILQNELRTWSELKRRAAKEGGATAASSTSGRPTPVSAGQGATNASPTIAPLRRWGGCVNGCSHDKINWPRGLLRKNTMEYQSQQLPPPAQSTLKPLEDESDSPAHTSQEPDQTATPTEPSPRKLSLSKKPSSRNFGANLPPPLASPNDASGDSSTSERDDNAALIRPFHQQPHPRTAAIMRHLSPPQRAPGDGFSDDSDYFPGMQYLQLHGNGHRKLLRSNSKPRQESKERKLARRQTEQSWKEESGMGIGAKTDRLGDGDVTSDDAGRAAKGKAQESEYPILKEALKGDMVAENGEDDESSTDDATVKKGLSAADVDKMKEAEQKALAEVY